MKLEAPSIDIKTIERADYAECKRWLGRFAVMDQALEASKASWYEGWGEGGITAWYLANPQQPRGQKYDEAVERERLRMLQLQSALPSKGRIPFLPVDTASDAVEHLTATASAEALERVGILGENLVPATGALAVYALTRADIYQAADRFIVASMPVLDAREIVRQLRQSGITTNVYWRHMYDDGTQLPTLENYRQWWQQLDHDLVRVDEAFAA